MVVWVLKFCGESVGWFEGKAYGSDMLERMYEGAMGVCSLYGPLVSCCAGRLLEWGLRDGTIDRLDATKAQRVSHVRGG